MSYKLHDKCFRKPDCVNEKEIYSYIDGLVKDTCISIAKTIDILPPGTKPSIYT